MIELAADPRQVRDIQNFQTEVRQVLKIIRRRIEDEELRHDEGADRFRPPASERRPRTQEALQQKLQVTRETPACRPTQYSVHLSLHSCHMGHSRPSPS